MLQRWKASARQEHGPPSADRLDLRFKMVEQKDVLSSSTARTPKSKLAVEQPLTGRCWNPIKKDTPGPKTKKATVRW